ncbi:MAG TPA: hypothetical protein V6D25_09955 [Leptolyngbyaceae cyanobacterium]
MNSDNFWIVHLVMLNFFGSAIAGIVLGVCQGLPLEKILKQKALSNNISRISIKWIIATTIGFSLGGIVTNLWIDYLHGIFTNLTNNGDQILFGKMFLLKLFTILIFIGLAQGIMMKMSIKKISPWLKAHINSILASFLVGMFPYFILNALIAILPAGGIVTLGVIWIISPLTITLSTGLIYGCITFFSLPSLFNNNEV